MKYIKARLQDDCFKNGYEVTFKDDLSNKRLGITIGYMDHPIHGNVYFVINIRCMISVSLEDKTITYANYDDFKTDFLI